MPSFRILLHDYISKEEKEWYSITDTVSDFFIVDLKFSTKKKVIEIFRFG